MPEQTATGQNLSRANQVVDNQYLAYGIKIIGGIVVIVFFFMIAKVVSLLVKKAMMRNTTEANHESTLKIAELLSNIAFYIMILIAVFIGFDVMGINLGLLVGGVSFGLGLAFKELLGNMFAGIMILYTKEFKIGDIIEIKMDQVYFGRIEEISIRYTVIRTLDLRQVVIPNISLITVPIKTFSSEELVRLDTVIGIHYNSDVAKAIELVVATINSFDFVKEKASTKSYVLNLADSAVELKCLFFFDPKCGIVGEAAIGAIQEKIFEVFRQHGIEIPYNQTTLSFENTESKKKILQQLTTHDDGSNTTPQQENSQAQTYNTQTQTPPPTANQSPQNRQYTQNTTNITQHQHL